MSKILYECALSLILLFTTSNLCLAQGSPPLIYHYDGYSVSSYATSLSITDFNIPSGMNKPLLLVFETTQEGGIATSVSWNGTPLAKAIGGSGSEALYSIWYLVNPAPGSNTLLINFLNSSFRQYGVALLTGVDQTNPLDGAPVHNSAGIPSISIATHQSNELVIGMFIAGASFSIHNEDGSLWEASTAHYISRGFYKNLSNPGQVTISASQPASNWDALAVAIAPAPVPQISNLHCSQRGDGSGLVDVTYDLSGGPTSVSVVFSSDNGQHWDVTPTSTTLTDDVGTNISSGVNRHIVWDAGRDRPMVKWPQARAKLTAADPMEPQITVLLPGYVPLEYVPLELVRIPAGSFTMGSDSGLANERPPHTVNIAHDFYLGKYEITQRQWAAVMGANPSSHIGPDFPVEQVSWNDCQTFVTEFNKLGWGTFRLPSEAEWEYACRAGTDTNWICGNAEAQLVDYAWYSTNSGDHTHDVGGRSPNQFGLYDMHGNVSEYCQDWDHPNYNGAPEDGRVWYDPPGSYPVHRGGAYSFDSSYCRSAHRDRTDPPNRHASTGLRLAATSIGASTEETSDPFDLNTIDLWTQTTLVQSTTHPNGDEWYNNRDFQATWSTEGFPANTIGWLWLIDDEGMTTVTLANGYALPFATQFIEQADLTDGMHVLHLSPMDSLGQPITSAQADFHFRINLQAPAITSPTHPDMTKAYTATAAVLNWDWFARGGGAVSNFQYAYAVTDNKDFSVAIEPHSKTEDTSVTLTGLSFGTHYFHLVAIDSLGTTGTAIATFPLHIGESSLRLEERFNMDWATDRNIEVQTTITEPNDTYNAMVDAWYFKNWPIDRKPIVQNMSMQNGIHKSITWDITNVPGGTYNIGVTYVDSNGTTRTAQSAGKVTVWPGPMKVTSPTHPQSARWYESPNVTINWQRPDNCEPNAIKGFRYLRDRKPDTIPSMSDTAASSDTLLANVTVNQSDSGANFFHIRWLDRDGNLSRRTTHFMFNAWTDFNNNYMDLPWFDDFAPSLDGNLWYISNPTDVTVANSRLRIKNRGYLKSISTLFNDPRNNGPYQIDLNGVNLDANAFLVIATRSDNNPRHPDLTALPEGERAAKARIINRGIEIYLTQTKAEIWMRNVVNGTPNDQFLEQATLSSGTKDISILDTGETISLFVNDNPVAVIEKLAIANIDGGFFFMGGMYNDTSSAASFDAVHIFQAVRPSLPGVGIKSETNLLHIINKPPVFTWFFPITDTQGMYQVQVQDIDSTWQQLPIWDSKEQASLADQCQYGASGGSPANPPPLVEGKRYKFRVRAKNRTLWSPWSGQNEQGDEFMLNQLPLVTDVTIAPAAPTDDDPLTATASGSDPQSDPVSFSYRWFCDQVLVSDLTGATVSANRTMAGQVWRVEVTPFDGFSHGPPQSSPEVTIGPTPAKNNVQAIWTIYH